MLSTGRYSKKQTKKKKVHSNTKCYYNDKVRPPCKLTTFQKWLQTLSAQASQCSLKTFAFSKSVVLKLHRKNQPDSFLSLPINHLVSGESQPSCEHFYVQIITSLEKAY